MDQIQNQSSLSINPSPDSRDGRRVLTVIVAAFLIIGMALGGFWLYLERKALGQVPNSFGVLMTESQAFREGENLLRSGMPEQALEKFTQALRGVSDPLQEGQIKFKIAVATGDSAEGTNYLAAIPLYKEIAANTAYSKVMRAQAVEEMGLIFTRYADEEVTNLIFSTEPYTSMRDPKNTWLSYRRLFEYASSLYPLAISELRVADWHANKVLTNARTLTKKANIPLASFSTNEGRDSIRKVLISEGKDPDTVLNPLIEDERIIAERIANADADIERIRDLPNENRELPAILQRKGVILSRMQQAGNDSFGDAEETFKRSLELYASANNTANDGYARYYYAQFLMNKHGSARHEDVRAILSPFYTTNTYNGGAVEHFFRSERSNVLSAKSTLVQLAGIDPRFKLYLMNLGWKEEDFK